MGEAAQRFLGMARETSGTRHEGRIVTVNTIRTLKNAAGLDQEIGKEGSASANGVGQETDETDGIRMKAAGIEAEIKTGIEMVMQRKGVIMKE